MALIGRIYAPIVAVPRSATTSRWARGRPRSPRSSSEPRDYHRTFPLLTGTVEALLPLLPTGIELVAPEPGATIGL
jgi:hypothetical protein